jgi:hypothetical protein
MSEYRDKSWNTKTVVGLDTSDARMVGDEMKWGNGTASKRPENIKAAVVRLEYCRCFLLVTDK